MNKFESKPTHVRQHAIFFTLGVKKQKKASKWLSCWIANIEHFYSLAKKVILNFVSEQNQLTNENEKGEVVELNNKKITVELDF